MKEMIDGMKVLKVTRLDLYETATRRKCLSLRTSRAIRCSCSKHRNINHARIDCYPSITAVGEASGEASRARVNLPYQDSSIDPSIQTIGRGRFSKWQRGFVFTKPHLVILENGNAISS